MGKLIRTGTLPGMKVPGHDEKVMAAAVQFVDAKEHTTASKKREKECAEELLEVMKTKKLTHYHDADAKIRVEVSKSRETVKVLKDKPAKPRGGRR
jgi:hypothetical protein